MMIIGVHPIKNQVNYGMMKYTMTRLLLIGVINQIIQMIIKGEKMINLVVVVVDAVVVVDVAKEEVVLVEAEGEVHRVINLGVDKKKDKEVIVKNYLITLMVKIKLIIVKIFL